MEAKWMYDVGRVLDTVVLSSLVLSYFALAVKSKFQIDSLAVTTLTIYLICYFIKVLTDYEVFVSQLYIFSILNIFNNLALTKDHSKVAKQANLTKTAQKVSEADQDNKDNQDTEVVQAGDLRPQTEEEQGGSQSRT
jgi:hypothetical protein